MKRIQTIIQAVFFASLLMMTSCEGPEGPAGTVGSKGDTGTSGVAGANGKDGTNGVDGTAGPKGDTGTANVQYTEWSSPTWDNYSRSNDKTSAFFGVIRGENKLLTQEVFDKAAIFVYVKFNTREYDNANGEYRLVSRISEINSSITKYGSLLIPGRDESLYDNYTEFYVGLNYDLGVNSFRPFIQINTRKQVYNSNDGTNTFTLIPEFMDYKRADFENLMKDTPKFRIVIIPGAVKVGRMATVDYSDYAAVQHAFDIKD